MKKVFYILSFCALVFFSYSCSKTCTCTTYVEDQAVHAYTDEFTGIKDCSELSNISIEEELYFYSGGSYYITTKTGVECK